MSSYMKEHNDFNYTKEKDEVERYLLRVIHRYFQVEDEYSRAQIESMIVESIKRLKQWLVKDKGFIFSLNRRTGHIHLTIQDFNGEPVFEKNLAFNKNFGDIADTICEGNDPRLSDAREPNDHVHEIDDITGLRERLYNLIEKRGYHVHKNKNVLDMLRYTGTAVEFDLIIIEYLEKSLEDYLERMEYYYTELRGYYAKHIMELTVIINEIIKIIQELQAIDETAIDWLEEAKRYTRDKNAKLTNNSLKLLIDYWSKASYDAVADYLKTAEYIIATGEIPINDPIIQFDTHVTGHEEIKERQVVGYEPSTFEFRDLTPEEQAEVNANPIYKDDRGNNFDFHKVHNGKTIQVTFANVGFASRLYINGIQKSISQNGCTIDDSIQVSMTFTPLNAAMIKVTYRFENISSANNYNNLVVAGYADIQIGDDDSAAVVPIMDSGNTVGITMTSRNPSDGGAALAYILQDFDSLIYGKFSTIEANWLAEPDETNIYQKTTFDKGGGSGGAGDSGLAYRKRFDDFNPGDVVEFSCIFGIYIPDLMYLKPGGPIYDDVTIGTHDVGSTDVIYESETIEDVTTTATVIPGTDPGKIDVGQTKLYLRYEVDGKTITEPLPVMKVIDNLGLLAVQGCKADDGNVYIKTTLNKDMPFVMSACDVYNKKLIGIINSVEKYNDIISKCQGTGVELFKVANATELTKVLAAIPSANHDTNYLIQGHISGSLEYDFKYNDGSVVSFAPFRDDIYVEYGDGMNLSVDKDHSGKMNITDTSDGYHCFIVQMDMRTLKDFYSNARIYYEIKGK